jgi:hypothetical protein
VQAGRRINTPLGEGQDGAGQLAGLGDRRLRVLADLEVWPFVTHVVVDVVADLAGIADDRTQARDDTIRDRHTRKRDAAGLEVGGERFEFRDVELARGALDGKG